MIPAAVCLAVMLLALYRFCRKDPPLDGDEIRILRRLSDRIRIEQDLPFD